MDGNEISWQEYQAMLITGDVIEEPIEWDDEDVFIEEPSDWCPKVVLDEKGEADWMETWFGISPLQQEDFVFFQFVYYSGDQWSFFTDLFDDAVQSGKYKEDEFPKWYDKTYETPFIVVVNDWLVSIDCDPIPGSDDNKAKLLSQNGLRAPENFSLLNDRLKAAEAKTAKMTSVVVALSCILAIVTLSFIGCSLIKRGNKPQTVLEPSAPTKEE